MRTRKNWKSPQALIIMALVTLIFVYIGLDMAKTKPQIKSDLIEVKHDYLELSSFLDTKIPEIDSTLRIQSDQLTRQGSEIDALNETVREMTDPIE